MSAIDEVLGYTGRQPVPSPAAEFALRAVERRLRRRLPREFRALMALQNGPSLLAEVSISSSDWPISPDELARPLEKWQGYDPIAEHLLPFMIENQGVCVWAIRLDDSHDPAVVVEVDSGSPPRWQLCADRFSDWLKCQVHDRLLFDASWFAAQAPPLSPHVLAELRRRFDESLQTYAWPGNTNYRFSNARSQLLLWSADEQCDWKIAPRSSDVATTALDEIDEIAGIGSGLYARKEESRCILHEWQIMMAKNQPRQGRMSP